MQSIDLNLIWDSYSVGIQGSPWSGIAKHHQLMAGLVHWSLAYVKNWLVSTGTEEQSGGGERNVKQ